MAFALFTSIRNLKIVFLKRSNIVTCTMYLLLSIMVCISRRTISLLNVYTCLRIFFQKTLPNIMDFDTSLKQKFLLLGFNISKKSPEQGDQRLYFDNMIQSHAFLTVIFKMQSLGKETLLSGICSVYFFAGFAVFLAFAAFFAGGLASVLIYNSH